MVAQLNRSRLAASLALVSLTSCVFPSGEQAPATPQRPTLSSDTNTTAQGTVELEAGGVIDPADFLEIPTTLKFGVGPRTELFTNWSPYVKQDQPGTDARGQSDLDVGFRHRFLKESEAFPSAAVQITTKIPTGSTREGLSSGEVDFFAAGILSKAMGNASVTAFYELGMLGEANGPDTDVQHSLALAGSYPLLEDLSGFAELAGVFIHEQRFQSVFSTVGVAYPLNPGTVFDVATVIGWSDDAPDFQLVFGATVNFGQLFVDP